MASRGIGSPSTPSARPARTWFASRRFRGLRPRGVQERLRAPSWARRGSRLSASCAGRKPSPARARGSCRPPTISPRSQDGPGTSTLYRWGTLPGVSNLYKLGVLPIKNYTTNLTTVDMTTWEPAKLRAGFDHRGHQCNACGMHHCHIQVIGKGPKRASWSTSPNTKDGPARAGRSASPTRKPSPGSIRASTRVPRRERVSAGCAAGSWNAWRRVT